MSNEEFTGLNGESTSKNDEIETSKEVLQALNKELTAVNSQLQDKVEELDRANNDLTNLITATGIATVFLDRELKIERFTPPTATLLNLMPTAIGRPFRDLAPRFDDSDLLSDAKEVLRTLAASEKEVCTEDDHWYLRRILPYRSGDDRIGGVVVTFVDITKRVAAEAQARRLATVLLDSNDAVTVCALDGTITAWNKSAEEMFGYPAEKALTMNIQALIPDDQSDELADLLGRVSGGEAGSYETRRLASDGHLVDVWLTATPLKDHSGDVVAMATTERDITARRQAEEEIRSLNAILEERVARRTSELQASEQKIRSVLDAAVDAIVTIDAEGTIETFNAAAEKMFGYTSAEAIGRNVSMLMPSSYREKHDSYLDRYRKTREPRVVGNTRHFRAVRRDGTEFPIQLSVRAIGDSELFTGVVRDLTEQRLLQQEVTRVAEAEQRRIGEELHDSTQQALTGLGLLAQNLSDALEEEDGGPNGKLAAKLAAGLADVNQQVRALAKGLIPAPVDAEGLTAGLQQLAQRTEADHGIRCRYDCPATVSIADDQTASHLYRIAQEAVTNAVKHAEARTVTIRLRDDGRAIWLEVEDDGIGISADALDGQHRGLGLRVMAHRCNMGGGELTVKRREIRGTVVRCWLPRVERS